MKKRFNNPKHKKAQNPQATKLVHDEWDTLLESLQMYSPDFMANRDQPCKSEVRDDGCKISANVTKRI